MDGALSSRVKRLVVQSTVYSLYCRS